MTVFAGPVGTAAGAALLGRMAGLRVPSSSRATTAQALRGFSRLFVHKTRGKVTGPRRRRDLAARGLHQGRFAWLKDEGRRLTLAREQLDALVLGVPWKRIGEPGVIRVL